MKEFLILSLFMGVVFNSLAFADAEKKLSLIDKLVQKRVLTQKDAEELRHGHGKWKSPIKFYGDFRLRYQTEKRRLSAGRDRYRYSLRLKAKTKISENTKLKFAIATGGINPRSTNQTFDNSFETSSVGIYYAYAEHKLGALKILGGKIKNPVWRPTDLLWDTDIYPEGVGFQFDVIRKEDVGFFINAGYFIIEEVSTSQSPSVFVVQPGIDYQAGDVNIKAAFVYYEIRNIPGTVLANSSGTNQVDGGGAHLKDYGVSGFTAKFTVPGPGPSKISVFGEYFSNQRVVSNSDAFAYGLSIGNNKVRKKGTWSTKVQYKHTEREAWLDIFPDADAYGGGTNTRGIEISSKYAAFDNVILGLDYYRMNPITGVSNIEDLFQLDITFLF